MHVHSTYVAALACVGAIPAGVFTFGSKKEAKPHGMPFDLAASLKRTPKSYTPYRGKYTVIMDNVSCTQTPSLCMQ